MAAESNKACAAFIIWGANTGVGKTLISAGLVRAAARRTPTLYLKPVQTGCPADSDGRHVALLAGGLPHTIGSHAAVTKLLPSPGSNSSSSSSFSKSYAQTLFAWCQPVSPHVAVATEGRGVDDEELLSATRAQLATFAVASDGLQQSSGRKLGFVETAGGVASPAPSGTLQCDALRPLSLPSLLVGDGKLGGISQTICAAESLSSRGHEIGLVVLLSDLDGQSKVSSTLGNAESLRSHFGAGIPIFELPEPPPMPGSSDADDAIGDASCGHDLDDWLEKTSAAFDSILDEIESVHEVREHRTSAHGIDGNAHGECPYLREKQPVAEEAAGSPTAATEDPSMTAATEALLADDMRLLWHPYTSTTRPLPCLPVKSASGVRLRLHDGTQLIDGMSSWWCTIHGYAVPELDRAVASQIGRMSHVMFGGLTHQSAVGLAQRLVECTLSRCSASSSAIAARSRSKSQSRWRFSTTRPEACKDGTGF